MEKILTWLQGKKGVLAMIYGAINTYLLQKGVYGDLEAALIITIGIALFGSASYFTNKMYSK